MNNKARLILTLSISGLFFIVDRWIKNMSVGPWTGRILLNSYIGWFPSHNAGIAFGLPIPVWVSISLTIPILTILAYLFFRSILSPIFNIQYSISSFALSLILFGALSNFYDRIVYRGTLDYFLILTSIINLADVMIVGGFILLMLNYKKSNIQAPNKDV